MANAVLGFRMVLDGDAPVARPDDRCIDEDRWWIGFQVQIVPAQCEEFARSYSSADEEIDHFVELLRSGPAQGRFLFPSDQLGPEFLELCSVQCLGFGRLRPWNG